MDKIFNPNAVNHPFMDDSRCVDRLVSDYNKYGSLSIAWDFDNTLFDYNNTGGNFSEVINLAKRCSELPYIKNCLWTSNEGEKLNFALQYCNHFSIKFDYINESPIDCGQKTRKPFFSHLIDDRAGMSASVRILEMALSKINLSNTTKS